MWNHDLTQWHKEPDMTDFGGLMLFTVIHPVVVGLNWTRSPHLKKKMLIWRILTLLNWEKGSEKRSTVIVIQNDISSR